VILFQEIGIQTGGTRFSAEQDISRHPTERAQIDPANLKMRLSVNQESTQTANITSMPLG
jgi:hypothetical protein